jgi:phosphoglycerate dehydrogenase-like enzyme
VKAGKWPRSANIPLRGQTLGILGLGRIGKAVALRGKSFLMNVVAYEPFPDEKFVKENGITLLPFDDVVKQADWLSLHMPMSPESSKCINKRTLGLMKPTAYVVNTARGGVINEPDLYDALKNKRIAGAGLDVFDVEPPPANHPLLTLDNVLFTAHMAGVDYKSRDDMALLAANAIAKLLAGDWPADWIVNPKVRDKFFAK